MKNTFEISSWDEAPYLELDNGVKYSRATIKKKYQGRLEGNGQLEYVMAYHGDGSASFVGLEYFLGSFDGKQGSTTFEHRGTFREGVAESKFNVIAGSSNDKLVGLTGSGAYTTGHSMTVEFTLMFNINDRL